MVLIITVLACAETGEVMHEFDRCDSLDHLETQLILASQPQRSAKQYADGRAVHLLAEALVDPCLSSSAPDNGDVSRQAW